QSLDHAALNKEIIARRKASRADREFPRSVRRFPRVASFQNHEAPNLRHTGDHWRMLNCFRARTASNKVDDRRRQTRSDGVSSIDVQRNKGAVRLGADRRRVITLDE